MKKWNKLPLEIKQHSNSCMFIAVAEGIRPTVTVDYDDVVSVWLWKTVTLQAYMYILCFHWAPHDCVSLHAGVALL